MTAKKFILAWLASFVAVFVLAWLWHLVILAGFYQAQTQAIAREEPLMLFIVLGELVLTLLMVIIYPLGYQGGSPAKEGIRFGVLIGLIWILPWSLIIHGIWQYPLASVVVDAAWHIVEEGIAGLLIGIIYGTGKAAEAIAETPVPETSV